MPADVCEVIASGSTPKPHLMYSGSGDIPFIKVYNLTHDGRLDFSIKPTFIDRETHERALNRSRARPGDVLMNIVGPPLGKVSIVPDEFPEWNINQAVVVFRPTRAVLNRYLAYALLTDSLLGRLTSRAKATAGQFNIGVSMCRTLLPIPIAPVTEQRRIVAKIEELFSELDAGVAALERVQKTVRRYRVSLLMAAVSGRLTEEWRKQIANAEPGQRLLARVAKERRTRWEQDQLRKFGGAKRALPKNWQEKYPAPTEVNTSELPSLPATWTWTTLDAIADIAGGVTKGQRHLPGTKLREVPYLRVANVQRGFLDLDEIKTIAATEADIAALRLQKGDILFNEGGDRDKLGRGWVWNDEIEECVHQNHVFRARVLLPEIQPKFISFHGNSFGQQWFLKTGKQSVNLASINMGVLRRFPVPLPPADEQAQIVAEVERRLSVIEAVEAEIEHGLLRAARLRQSILKRAFEGKLAPQDGTDEPADKLLERLRVRHDGSTTDSQRLSPRPRRKSRSTSMTAAMKEGLFNA